MKILLIQPRPLRGGPGFPDLIRLEPLALETIGAGLSRNHDVRVLDLFVPTDLDLELRRFQPDIVGISCSFTVDVPRCQQIISTVAAHNPHCHILIGGHHATLNPSDFLSSPITAIICGEGEETAVSAVDALATNKQLTDIPGLLVKNHNTWAQTTPRPLLSDLDRLPVPDRTLTRRFRTCYYMGMRRPVATIETSRGCPYRCSFCSIWRFYRGTVRTKSINRCLEDLTAISEQDIMFTDDNFLADIRWASQLVQAIISHRINKRFIFQARSDSIANNPELIAAWKQAGLCGVFVGLEKIDDASLDNIKKRTTVRTNEQAVDTLHCHNIKMYSAFIVDPQFDKGDFARLKHYVRSLHLTHPYFSVLTPLPGTELYERLRRSLTTTNHELFDLLHAVVDTRLPLPEFYRQLTGLYRDCYLSTHNGLPTIKWLIGSIVGCRLSWHHLTTLLRGIRTMGNPDRYLAAHKDTSEFGPPVL